MASPLYTAAKPELSTLRAALLPPCHDAIVPSSVANMKCEPPKFAALGLKTCPVGAEGGVPPFGGGTETTNGILSPAPLYRVARPVRLSETQNGEVGPNDTPQGLTRSGSVVLASPGISDTRLVCVKLFETPSASTRCALVATRTIAATTKTMRYKLFSIVVIGLTSCELCGVASLFACEESCNSNRKHLVNDHPVLRVPPLQTSHLDVPKPPPSKRQTCGQLLISRVTGQVPTTSQKRGLRKYPFDTETARPVVTRAAERKNGTGSFDLICPFLPRVFLLS